jgi:hypothetical protein
MSFELSLVYGEGLIYSLMIFIIPILNLSVALWIFVFSLLISFLLAIVGVFIDRRSDLFFIIPVYVLLKYVTAYIFLEQFVKEVILRKREMVWFKPERVSLDGLSS